MSALVLALVLAGAPAAPRIWQVPKSLDVVDVPGHVTALGVPIGMHAVRSGESAEYLERWFRAEFIKADLYVPPPWHLEQATAAAQVTGLDPDALIAYTIFLVPNPDRTTTVVVTEAFLSQRREAKAVGFAPLMPGAKRQLQTQTEGVDVLYYVATGTAADVQRFHADVLGKAGYKETSPGVFQRRDDVLKVSATPRTGGEVAVQVLHRRAIEGASP
jgi:hypothetical protein